MPAPEPSADAKSIFGRALELEPAARPAYLDAACAGDYELRARIDGLLSAHARAGEFMREPAVAGAPDGAATSELVTERPGTVVGQYRLMEQIGEGGMGLVFVAEQAQPMRRKVALKVIKPGMDSRQVVGRFEAERQALALMDHPNIAKVFDAGTTDLGRPYFVMELVRGVPITEYCDAHSLPPRERLELFVQVCRAVQHAHQKGVIHRDLKPSNVLVAPHDGVPVVKVIDFGVAKALGQSLTDKTIYTRFQQMIGTPLYMSPEQAEINQLDVDTRSDVYSLGVLLYELLTGTTPFDGARFKRAAFDEIRRIIREEEPPKPSTRLTSLGATLTEVSARRGTDPGKLSGLVRGELDWIVMKCLEKDRSRRYETVTGLAKDVQRFLSDEPVEARAASVWYRTRKAYHRNRAALLVTTGFALLLLLGLGLVTWKWQAERRARADADTARRDAEDRTREIEAAAERMNEANAAIDLAGQQLSLQQWGAAAASHNRAVELRRDHFQVWLSRGDMYAQMGLWDLALSDYTEAFARREPDTMRPWMRYALLLAWGGEEARYQIVCRRIADRFGASESPYVVTHLIRTCTALPRVAASDDWPLPVPHSELPGSVQWVSWYCEGLNHFRRGRDAQAVTALRTSMTRTNYMARMMSAPVLAVALHRAGDRPAARREVDNSRREYQQRTNTALIAGNQFVPWEREHWHDWVEFLIRCREMDRIVDGASPVTDPRALALRGQAFAALGRIDRASAEFARALRLGPDDPAVRAACRAQQLDSK